MAAISEEGNENNGGINRISTLPNSLLYHILSFLPTKTCVHTSLVSRTWRNLWKNLQVFDFHEDCVHTEKFLSFTVFVNAVLALRNSNVVRKFCLSCDLYENDTDTFFAYSIQTWMHAAIGPHLEEFSLTLITDDSNNLPRTLFSCSNLVSLSLKGNILLQLQDSSQICLPSLKVLKLQDMGDLDLNSVNILLSRCPILENLELCFDPVSLAKLRVSSSSLKWLKIEVRNKVGTCLEINVPGLKYLSLTVVTLGGVVANLHNVEEAYLAIFSTSESKSDEPLLNLIRALSGIKHLELFGSTTKWLFAAHVLDFPEFRYLLHLYLELSFFNSNFLFDMLQKCPMLQTLKTVFCKGDRSYDSSPSYRWEMKSTSVPKCLVSCLTFFRFRGVRVNELEFIGHILQNGLVLKTMIVDDFWLDSLDQLEEWKKKISDLPRGSAMWEVKFNIATPCRKYRPKRKRWLQRRRPR